MYINPFNRETDEPKLLEFVRQHPFGTLVSASANVPVATHLPFNVVEQDGQACLLTHLARANPQWRQLTPEMEVLVIFGGPYAYISPRWYDHVNVPTMNYVAVHAYGNARVVDDPDELYALLQGQIAQFEPDPEAYNLQTLPPAFLKAEIRALVALQISVQRWEGNFKLSQNRDEPNYRNIITQLEQQPGSTQVTEAMKEVYYRKGYRT